MDADAKLQRESRDNEARVVGLFPGVTLVRPASVHVHNRREDGVFGVRGVRFWDSSFGDAHFRHHRRTLSVRSAQDKRRTSRSGCDVSARDSSINGSGSICVGLGPANATCEYFI